MKAVRTITILKHVISPSMNKETNHWQRKKSEGGGKEQMMTTAVSFATSSVGMTTSASLSSQPHPHI
jgi:coproporphyrinogen III oxidase